MKKLIPEKSVKNNENGKYLATLYADTYAELAGVTELDGVTLDSGSQALTADGEACVLDSAGVWHKKDGTAVSANA